MDAEILGNILAFVVAIVGIGCCTGLLATWMKRRGSREVKPSPDILRRFDEVVERLNRLDNAVDTVAVEVERISEAQRFTSRILSERAGVPVLSDKSRAGGSTPSH